MRKQHPDEKILDEKLAQYLPPCLECDIKCKNVNELKVHLSTAHAFQFAVGVKSFENQRGQFHAQCNIIKVVLFCHAQCNMIKCVLHYRHQKLIFFSSDI